MAHIGDVADELTRYVIDYFGNLMTPHERVGYRSVLGELKIKNNPEQEKGLRNLFVSKDPDVMELLQNGHTAFLLGVRDRILREHVDKVFLNLCPRCNTLARTPRSKQCWQCFFDWHDVSEAKTESIDKRK